MIITSAPMISVTVSALATRGPTTPDHVIRTKRVALIVEGDPEEAVATFGEAYRQCGQNAQIDNEYDNGR